MALSAFQERLRQALDHSRRGGSPGSAPLTIIPQDQTLNGRVAEIEQVIAPSFCVWSGVNGSTLQSVPTTVSRTAAQNACRPDGVHSICFNQADLAFTPGVLAFTRVITADRIGVQFGSGAPSSEVGEILDRIFI